MPGSLNAIKGIAFPFRLGKTSLPAVNEKTATVVDSVKSLLLTGIFEVPMAPTLGTNLYSFIFENVNPLTEARVSQEIRNIIENNEPRMRVLYVESSALGDDIAGYTIQIDIQYELNGESGTLVLNA